MPEYVGQAAKDGPERTLHRHTFVGVDVSLLPEDEFPGYHEMRAATAELLQEAATFSAQIESGRRLALSIRNLAGHALPSGATAERQMWVEAVVTDAAGAIVFESGTLDERGDLRDGVLGHSTEPGSHPQLIYFGQQLLNVRGFDFAGDFERQQRLAEASQACRPMGHGAIEPGSDSATVEKPWQANWQCNYLIEPDATYTDGYQLPELPPGRYTANLRLLFRTFPPHFLRKLEAQGGLDPSVKTRVPIVQMAHVELSFSL